MMADYDSNIIKPVEGLQSVTGLTSAKRREEKNRRQQLKQESQEKEEQLMNESDEQQDMDDSSEGWNEKQYNMNSGSTGIDYCA
ncbi:MAG: hypothetical protein ACYS17_02105 [Planctomycetota bacterium]|jgi:hypothetical protein